MSLSQKLPASWVYVLFAIKRLWLRLNTGDKIVLSLTILLVAAIPALFGTRLGAAMAHLPALLGAIAIGAFTCAVVSLLVTATMSSVRAHRYFTFLPEASRHRQTRIALEFIASSLVSLVYISVVILFLPPLQGVLPFATGLGTVLVGHGIIHGLQLVLRPAPLRSTSIQTLSGLSSRNRLAPFMAYAVMDRLPKSSSRFMRKANVNPLIWAIVILTALASGGAALAWKSPLLGISCLSSLLMILQCALLEPRVGNGPAIGAHSANLPIKRTRQDLWALAFPHLVFLIVALALIIFERNSTNAAIAVSRFFLTLWLLWLFLIMGALPSEFMWRTSPWIGSLAMIGSQVFPPIIPLLLAIATIIHTRDLMKLSLKGPALWPR